MKSEKYQHEITHEMTKEELKKTVQNLEEGEVFTVEFRMPESESGRKRGRDAGS